MRVNVFEKSVPIPHGAEESADVNIVKLFRFIHPLVLEIVDFENDIVRDELRLNRTEVHAYHIAVGIEVAKLYGPDACPRP